MGSVILGQLWLVQKEHGHCVPAAGRPAGELVRDVRNATTHTVQKGNAELRVLADEDAEAFDFHGTLLHAQYPCSVRSELRRQRHTINF